MSWESIEVMTGILGSKSPIEWFTISTTIYKSKKGENIARGSFLFGFEHMGYDST
jgi:hypothetical protein